MKNNDVFCKDCYFCSLSISGGTIWDVSICHHPDAPQGGKYYVMGIRDSTCVEMRIDESYCGKVGRWWVRSLEKKEKDNNVSN